MRRRTTLLDGREGEPFAACIGECVRLAEHRRHWMRTPEDWEPNDRSRARLVRSLSRHLLQRYPVPLFLEHAWFDSCELARGLWLHLARGFSLRRFPGLPFPLSKSAARGVMTAPRLFDVHRALRWGQVLGLGGSLALATSVCTTRLKEPQTDEPFWAKVIGFLARHEPIDAAEVTRIVDFLHGLRYVPADEFWQHGGGDEPVRADFELRGRTLASLRRYMETWREREIPRLLMRRAKPRRHWAPITVDAFECEDRDGDAVRTWVIRELLNDLALQIEGAVMGHCVGTYADECAKRESSIWSVSLRDDHGVRRVLTLEIDPARKAVVQASAKFNEDPDETSWSVVKRWAGIEGLELTECA